MQGQPACRAGEPSGQGEEPPPEGLGGGYPLSQTDPRRPAGQVVGHRLDGQPGAVGGEAARGEMVQPDAVLEVAYGILNLGVAAMVSLQFEQLPVPVGDEAVIAVFGEEGQLGTGRRLHPPDDEPYRRGVCLSLEGGAGGLGHIGGTVHPVRNRRPGIFGYRLDEIVQAFVLADGDGEVDIHPAADGGHGVGIEAAVGPHGELPPGPGMAHPAHRLMQEVGGAPGGVGPALAQAGHQHVAGSGGDDQQRVIAPLAGIAVVACALLGQSVSLADRRIKVDGKWRVAGSGAGLPGPRQQLAAHPVQLADLAPAKAAQEGAQGGWRFDYAAESAGRPAGAQRIGVVDAVAARQRGGHQGHDLVTGVSSARRIAQVEVLPEELGKAKAQGEGGRKDQPGIVDQAVVVEGDLDAVGVVAWQHLLGAPFLGPVFCLENHYLRFRGAPSGFFKDCPQSRLSVDSG